MALDQYANAMELTDALDDEATYLRLGFPANSDIPKWIRKMHENVDEFLLAMDMEYQGANPPAYEFEFYENLYPAPDTFGAMLAIFLNWMTFFR
jgi:hypothetical protein